MIYLVKKDIQVKSHPSSFSNYIITFWVNCTPAMSMWRLLNYTNIHLIKLFINKSMFSILIFSFSMSYHLSLILFLDCNIFLSDFILQKEENCHLKEMQFKMWGKKMNLFIHIRVTCVNWFVISMGANHAFVLWV